MSIEHLAIWVKDLEGMKNFYEQFFGAKAGALYHNPKKQFQSYFLSFSTGSRLELMSKESITDSAAYPLLGLAHFAMSVGSRERVNDLTEELRKAGYRIEGEPRTTGDGYYESVIADPEGNLVEITV